jgi:hypothetical protein
MSECSNKIRQSEHHQQLLAPENACCNSTLSGTRTTGEVVKPERYELREGMTSLQALALAHGATRDTDADRSVINRQKDAGSERQEIKPDGGQ